MNVLYLCHRFPYPPKRGGKIRPFNMIRHLNALGHRVSVASLARTPAELEEGSELAKHCHEFVATTVSAPAAGLRMIARLPTPAPSSFGYFYSAELKRKVDQLLATRSFDLIFVHCSSVAPYVARVDGIPKILDFGDMDSQKWLMYARFRRWPLSMGYWLEGVKLERRERQLARQFDLCTCTTRAELEIFEQYATGVRTGWFPNGVDAEFFAPDAQTYDPGRIGFVGRMDYYPNQQAMLHFCRAVLPLIQRQRPQVRLDIIGADPSNEIWSLADLPGVRVTGSVPDVRPYVRACAFTVAPLTIARGTQNKILESMAMGVPVISSLAAAGGRRCGTRAALVDRGF